MRNIESDLAPIRDSYQGGIENDRETLELHERQVAAMRSGNLKALAGILDEHFRTLEEEFATALHRRWDTLFGDVAEQTLRLGAPLRRSGFRQRGRRRAADVRDFRPRARPWGRRAAAGASERGPTSSRRWWWERRRRPGVSPVDGVPECRSTRARAS
jgi:hypothetical protein